TLPRRRHDHLHAALPGLRPTSRRHLAHRHDRSPMQKEPAPRRLGMVRTRLRNRDRRRGTPATRKAVPVTVLAAHRWRNNAEMIADVAKLGYITGDVLDTTYGRGGFWTVYMPE